LPEEPFGSSSPAYLVATVQAAWLSYSDLAYDKQGCPLRAIYGLSLVALFPLPMRCRMRNASILAAMLVLAVAVSSPTQEPKIKGKAAPQLRLHNGGHTATVHKILFTPGSGRLISVSADKTVRVWDVASGETISVFRMPSLAGKFGELYAAALAPDGDTLAVAGWGGAKTDAAFPPSIFLISLAREEIIKVLKGHTGSIRALSFSRDQKLLASGGDDQRIRLWDPQTGTAIQLKGHPNPIVDLRFHPTDATVLLSASQDQVRLWNVAQKSGKVLQTVRKVKDKKGNPTAKEFVLERRFRFARIAWSADGQQFVVAGPGVGDAWVGILVYDAKGKLHKRLSVDRNYHVITGVAFSASGKHVIVAAHDAWRSYVGRLLIEDGKEHIYGTVNNNWEPLARGDVAVAVKGKNATVAVGDDFDHRIYLWRGNAANPRILGGPQRLVTAVGWIYPDKGADPLPRVPTILWRSRLLEEEPDYAKKPPNGFYDRSFGFGKLVLGPVGPRPRN
jgi:hypothetical protein